MCNCKDVEIGSYGNTVEVDMPKHMTEYKNKRVAEWLSDKISIDECILKEVKTLWDLWIKTTWCCCGHNKLDWFIGVFPEDIPMMKFLWYKVQHNPCRPWDEDSFIPKTK